MQNVSTVIRRPVSIGTATAAGLVAFVAGAVIALGTPAMVAVLATSSTSNATVSVPAAGGEQIAHNRSEAGLGDARPVGGEQISHNRDEAGLPGRI